MEGCGDEQVVSRREGKWMRRSEISDDRGEGEGEGEGKEDLGLPRTRPVRMLHESNQGLTKHLA